MLDPEPALLALVLEADVGGVEAVVDEPCAAALELDPPVLLEEVEEAGALLAPVPAGVLEPVVGPLPIALAPVPLVLLAPGPVPAPVVEVPGVVEPALVSVGGELGAAGGSFCGEYMSGSRNSVIGIPRS